MSNQRIPSFDICSDTEFTVVSEPKNCQLNIDQIPKPVPSPIEIIDLSTSDDEEINKKADSLVENNFKSSKSDSGDTERESESRDRDRDSDTSDIIFQENQSGIDKNSKNLKPLKKTDLINLKNQPQLGWFEDSEKARKLRILTLGEQYNNNYTTGLAYATCSNDYMTYNNENGSNASSGTFPCKNIFTSDKKDELDADKIFIDMQSSSSSILMPFYEVFSNYISVIDQNYQRSSDGIEDDDSLEEMNREIDEFAIHENSRLAVYTSCKKLLLKDTEKKADHIQLEDYENYYSKAGLYKKVLVSLLEYTEKCLEMEQYLEIGQLLLSTESDLRETTKIRLPILKEICLKCLEHSKDVPISKKIESWPVIAVMGQVYKKNPGLYLTLFRRCLFPAIEQEIHQVDQLAYFDLAIHLIKNYNQPDKSYFKSLFPTIKSCLNTISFFSKPKDSIICLKRHKKFLRDSVDAERYDKLVKYLDEETQKD